MEKRKYRLQAITERLRINLKALHTFLRTSAFTDMFASKQSEKWQKE